MKVLVNGQLVEYRDEGKGSIILLLHGWGASLATFDRLANFLTDNHRVIRLDFPGFGGSPRPKAEWMIGDYAKFVGDFLDKLKIDSVEAIIGHSFGGRVIIKGISQKNFDAEKIVLIGAAGVRPSASAKKQLLKAVAKTGKLVTAIPGLHQLRGSLRQKLYNAAGSTDYLNAGEMQKIFINTVNEDLLPLVHNITQPTLMVWGENDDQTPISDAEKMKAEIKGSELVIIPEAGHFVYLDDALAVQRELERYL